MLVLSSSTTGSPCGMYSRANPTLLLLSTCVLLGQLITDRTQRFIFYFILLC
jgi:hypothetical protein